MKYTFCFLLLSVFWANAQTDNVTVSSPDGKLAVNVSLENGKPSYNISLNGKTFLNKSPLGLKTNVGDFTEGLVLKQNTSLRKIENT